MSIILDKTKTFFRNIIERAHHTLKPDEVTLIQNTHLFDSLDQVSFQALLRSFIVEYRLADDLIVREGTKGDALYIIAKGSVRVFTHDLEGKKIALARLNKGDYFGEQALLGHANMSRNASIEAIDDTQFILIKKNHLQAALQGNAPLKQKLVEKGNVQLLNNITQLVDVYRDIKSKLVAKSDNVLFFEKDQKIYSKGEESECVYIILEGSVNIKVPAVDGSEKSLILLRGHLFGELGILENLNRIGDAIALEHTKVICIPANDFREHYSRSPALKKLLSQLGTSYTLPGKGIVTQFYGTSDENNVITTTYKLARGRFILATTSDHTFVMTEKSVTKDQVHAFKNENIDIEIGVKHNFVVYVKCIGEWRDLKYVTAAIIDRKPVTPGLINEFEQTGRFKLRDPKDVAIVCVCMSVERDTIQDLISDGIKSFAKISEITGCGTVCGSCRPRILSMLGQNVWLAAKMNRVIAHNDKISSYIIEPSSDTFNAFIPGEHIVVQININGLWVERAYTLSDFNEDNKYRITVKKEEGGVFSNWVHEQASMEINVFASQPQGNFKLTIDSGNPLICFAGGIGITPFIAFAKSLCRSQPKREMHLIYIAPTQDDFIFLDELEKVKQTMSTFKLTLWERKKSGYLTDEHINKFVNSSPRADVYICGPEGFESSIVKSLRSINFREDKIFIEQFTYANPINKTQTVD